MSKNDEMIDLSAFQFQGDTTLVCTICGASVTWAETAKASLSSAVRFAREHVLERRRSSNVFCGAHRVNHDEQQAEEGDRCLDCGRSRHEHRNQCRVCGRQRSPRDEVVWRDRHLCSVACLTSAQAGGSEDAGPLCCSRVAPLERRGGAT